jgi:DNA polymerase III delta subunit
MASSQHRQSGFSRFISQFHAAESAISDRKSQAILIRGSAPDLVEFSSDYFRSLIGKLVGVCATAVDCSAGDFDSITRQSSRGLFGEDKITVVRFKSLRKKICLTADLLSPASRNWWIFVENSTGSASKLSCEEVPDLSLIEAPTLYANDAEAVVGFIAERLQLPMSPDSIKIASRLMGADVMAVTNCLRTLKLYRNDESDPLGVGELERALPAEASQGLFWLEDLLCAGQIAKAEVFAHGLLRRGEAALSVLAAIARFCRNYVQIGRLAAQGANQYESAQRLRLPIPVIKRYYNCKFNNSSRMLVEGMGRVIQWLHWGDIQLKNGAVPEWQVLSIVFSELSLVR